MGYLTSRVKLNTHEGFNASVGTMNCGCVMRYNPSSYPTVLTAYRILSQ